MAILGGGHGRVDKEGVPEHMPFTEKDITWNTHRDIREKFEYPEDDEFLGEWLQWFYNLNVQQRTALRNTDLSTVNVGDYPSRPATNKENP